MSRDGPRGDHAGGVEDTDGTVNLDDTTERDGQEVGPAGDSAGSGLAVLLALAIFVLSLVSYPVALVTGADVSWAVGSNAAAAVALVGWTARRNFLDPTSSVTTVPGAFGTALLVLGGYALVVAGVLALTGRWHDAGSVVVPVGLAGLTAVALGLGTFAFEAVFETPDTERDEPGEGGAGSSDDGE